MFVGNTLVSIPCFSSLLIQSSYLVLYTEALFLINCLESSPNAFLCVSVSFSHFVNLSYVLPMYWNTHALFAAVSNSDSLTTDCGSRVFINWNIADTSQGHVASLRDDNRLRELLYASSNAFT